MKSKTVIQNPKKKKPFNTLSCDCSFAFWWHFFFSFVHSVCKTTYWILALVFFFIVKWISCKSATPNKPTLNRKWMTKLSYGYYCHFVKTKDAVSSHLVLFSLFFFSLSSSYAIEVHDGKRRRSRRRYTRQLVIFIEVHSTFMMFDKRINCIIWIAFCTQFKWCFEALFHFRWAISLLVVCCCFFFLLVLFCVFFSMLCCPPWITLFHFSSSATGIYLLEIL